jgi:hypothetical protein
MSTSICLTPRMWFDEVERIGMRRCTPFGYSLNVIGGLFWFAGIVLIFGIPVYLAYTATVGDFSWSSLWLLTIPLVVIFLGSLSIAVSWLLASRKSSTTIMNAVNRVGSTAE